MQAIENFTATVNLATSSVSTIRGGVRPLFDYIRLASPIVVSCSQRSLILTAAVTTSLALNLELPILSCSRLVTLHCLHTTLSDVTLSISQLAVSETVTWWNWKVGQSSLPACLCRLATAIISKRCQCRSTDMSFSIASSWYCAFASLL